MFINLKKASDTVETEAVVEALGNHGVPTQYIRMLRELYDNFKTRISPFYKEVIINVKKRGVRQGDTISPKVSSAALENIMCHLEWEDLGAKVDGGYLHHIRFADDIVLITPSIEQAERMPAEFDSTCGKIGLRLNLTKTTAVLPDLSHAFEILSMQSALLNALWKGRYSEFPYTRKCRRESRVRSSVVNEDQGCR